MGLQPSTTNIAFGTWPASASVVRSATLTGATGTVSAQITGAGAAAFAVTASQGSADVTFHPTAVGSFAATLALTDSGTGTSTEIALSGTARANALTFTPAALHFGDVFVAAPMSLSVVVSNPGPLAATLAIAAGPFRVQTVAIPVGSTSTIVFFTPPATGSFSATVTASWSMPEGESQATLPALPSSLPLDGTGILAIQTEPEPGASSTRRRLLIDVPDPKAQLTLGARVLDTSTADAENIVDGFGLGTELHGFLNAHGTSSNLWMRAMKGFVVEARSSTAGNTGEGIWMMSQGDLVTACKGTASIVGGGGVVIAANNGGSTEKDGNDSSGGNPVDKGTSVNDPPTVNSASDRQGRAASAAATFGAIDAIIAFSFGARGLYNVIKGMIEDSKLPTKSFAATLGAVGSAGGFAGFGAGVAGLKGAVAGVTVYGEAGVVIGSGGFTGIHSISSLVLSSIFPLMFGVDAEIFAVDAVTITGMRHATLASHKDVTVQSDGDVSIKANGGGFGPIGRERLGKVEVQAKNKIRLAASTLLPLPQTTFVEIKPDSVTVDANRTVSVTAGTAAGYNVLNEAKLSMASAKIALAVAHYGATIKPAKLEASKITPAGAPDPTGPSLMMHDAKAVLKYANQAAVGVTQQGQVKLLAGGQQHKIIMGPATVTISSGARIMLQ